MAASGRSSLTGGGLKVNSKSFAPSKGGNARSGSKGRATGAKLGASAGRSNTGKPTSKTFAKGALKRSGATSLSTFNNMQMPYT